MASICLDLNVLTVPFYHYLVAYKDNTFSQYSYLYNGNPRAWKGCVVGVAPWNRYTLILKVITIFLGFIWNPQLDEKITN